MSIATNVLADTVIDGLMLRKFVSHASAAIVAHDVAGNIQLLAQNRTKRLGIHGRYMMGAHASATLNQRKNDFFTDAATAKVVTLVAVLIFFEAADIGLINLNGFSFTPERGVR